MNAIFNYYKYQEQLQVNVNHTTRWALNGEEKTRKHEISVRIGVEFKSCEDRYYEYLGELRKTGYKT
jgi:hypothetical protein